MLHTRNSFSLNGPSRALDPRINAMRGDLADVSLAGRHFSPHYARAIERMCLPKFAPVFDKPDGRQVSELLAGEGFMLLDISGGWAWGYCKHDHYVGYVDAASIGDSGSRAEPIVVSDPVAAAQGFLNQPYIWGGRGGGGIDCSGLIQRSLAAIGIAAPRDSDMQMEALGTELAIDAALEAGDLVFFPGHVGLMVDADRLIHATQKFGRVVIEPLADVVARVGEDHGGPIISRRRVSR